MIGGFGKRRKESMNNEERQKMKAVCEIFGVNIDDVECGLADLGEDGLMVSKEKYNYETNSYTFKSIKYYDVQKLSFSNFYYVMASLVLRGVKNVLEMGTGDGISTIVLSKLFPDANIFTVDLPQDDPMFSRWRRRSLPETVRGKQRQRRLSKKNITCFEKNTFFLPTLDLPMEFEFILVDGDHKYPQLAGDIMFAYNSIVEGGFVFFHDYYERRSVGVMLQKLLSGWHCEYQKKFLLFQCGHLLRRFMRKWHLL